MTDRDVMERVAALLGVSIVVVDKGIHKTEYRALLRGRAAADLMDDLRPLLGLRRRAAANRAIAAYNPPPPEKLAPVQCARILALRESGSTVTSLARTYQVSRPTVRTAAALLARPGPARAWRHDTIPEVEALSCHGLSGDELTWLAWLAGWLEGEGSFLRGPPSDPRRPRISGSSIDRDVLTNVAGLLGVGVTKSHPPRARMAGWSPLWTVLLCGTRAVETMETVRPAMGQRRQLQIDRALS